MSRRRGGTPTYEAQHGYRHCVSTRRCRECGTKAKPPRKTWCSQACVDTHRMRTDPGYQRMAVFARDHGICSACGRDCVSLRRDLMPLTRLNGASFTVLGHFNAHGSVAGLAAALGLDDRGVVALEAACQVVLDLGLLKHVTSRESFWDMDHRRPLWAGGTNDLKNLRTLCLPCHREATAEGAGARSRQRKNT